MKRPFITTGNKKKKKKKLSLIQHSQQLCDTNRIQVSPMIHSKEHDDVGIVLTNHHKQQYIIMMNQHDQHDNSDHDNPTVHSTTSSSITNTNMSIIDALSCVAIWKNRSKTHTLSHSIESTATLAQIIYRDYQQQQQQEWMNHHTMTTTPPLVISSLEIRNAYASAIIRAVNGLADILQQQRSIACSISILCTELGIPSWIVSIRHESTHNQLPSLSILRMTAISLLQYFQTIYWDPIRQYHTQQYNTIHTLLHNYQNMAINIEQQKTIVSKSVINHNTTTSNTTNMDNDDNVDVDDNDDSTDSTDNNDIDTIVIDGLWQSKIGTTSNRFAALIDNDTKKQKHTHIDHNNNNKHDDKQRTKPKTVKVISSTTRTTPPCKKKQSSSSITMGLQNNPTKHSTATTTTAGNCNDTELHNNSNNNNTTTCKQQQQGHKSLASYAKEIVTTTTEISFDIIQSSIIQHIIQQTKGIYQNDKKTTKMALNPHSNDTSNNHNHIHYPINIEILIHQYRPLLSAMGRLWPGFLCTFLLECCHEIIILLKQQHYNNHERPKQQQQQQHNHDDDIIIQSDTYSIGLEQWIYLLLSKEFVLPIIMIRNNDNTYTTNHPNDDDNDNNNNPQAKYVNFQMIQYIQYPLNRICDVLSLALRINSSGSSNDMNDTIERNHILSSPNHELSSSSSSSSSIEIVGTRILHVCLQILGTKHRYPHYGIDTIPSTSSCYNENNSVIGHIKQVEQPSGRDESSDVLIKHNTTTSDIAPSSSLLLSLDAMEALLSSSNDDDINDDSKTNHDIVTTKVTSTVQQNNDDDNNQIKDCTVHIDNDNHDPINPIIISSWVQCTNWEPCTIGSLPLS